MMAENRLMKEGLDKPAINRLANSLEQVFSQFDSRKFRQQAYHELKPKELKQRVTHISQVIHSHLNMGFPDCCKQKGLCLGFPVVDDKLR